MVCRLWPRPRDCGVFKVEHSSDMILYTVLPVAKGMSSVMKLVQIAVLVKRQVDLATTLLARRFRQLQIEIMYDMSPRVHNSVLRQFH